MKRLVIAEKPQSGGGSPPRRARVILRTLVVVALGVAAGSLPARGQEVSAKVNGPAAADTTPDTLSIGTLARTLGLPPALGRLVFARNPEIAAQRASLAAAGAQYRAAGFSPPAALAVEAEEVPGGLDLAHANTRLSVERDVFAGGRHRAARALAGTEMVAARAALAATVQRVFAITARAYVAAAGWRAIAHRFVAEDSLLASAGASLQARLTAGTARYAEVLRIRSARLRVESSATFARAEAVAARQGLVGLLGGTAAARDTVARAAAWSPADLAWLDSLLLASSAIAVAETLPPPPDLDSLLAASATVREADAAVAAAEASRSVILAGQRPRFTAYVGAQRFAREGRDFTVGPVFGGTMSLPFTAGPANAAARVAAEEEVRAARAARTATVASLRAELAAALARYEAAREQVAGYSAALLRGAREEREASLASYRSGEVTLLELIDFERALAQAETDRIRAAIDATDALATLVAPEQPAPGMQPAPVVPSSRRASDGGTSSLAEVP